MIANVGTDMRWTKYYTYPTWFEVFHTMELFNTMQSITFPPIENFGSLVTAFKVVVMADWYKHSPQYYREHNINYNEIRKRNQDNIEIHAKVIELEKWILEEMLELKNLTFKDLSMAFALANPLQRKDDKELPNGFTPMLNSAGMC